MQLYATEAAEAAKVAKHNADLRTSGLNPRAQTLEIEPSGSNSLRARGGSWYAADVGRPAVVSTVLYGSQTYDL